MTKETKELTPAQKAAQTRAANKAAKATEKAQEAEAAPTPSNPTTGDYKGVVEALEEIYGLGLNVKVSRNVFNQIKQDNGFEDK